MKPTPEELSRYFAISDELKGLIFARDSGRGGRYKAGTKAGSTQETGHRVVCFSKRYYPESNVVWAIHHGSWPAGSISNLNGDLQDNRPENLYASGSGSGGGISEKDISIERLRMLFSHDEATGHLIRKVAKPPHTKAGDIAGFINDGGYVLVSVDGLHLRAHRIAWAIHNGRWPEKDIDHVNGIRADNRIANLREASKSENAQNSFVRCNSETGVKGVKLRKDTGKFEAYLQVNKKMFSLGCFDDIEAAIEARRGAELVYHPFRKAS